MMSHNKVIGPVGQVIRHARTVVNVYRGLRADGDTSLDKLAPHIAGLEEALKAKDALEQRRRFRNDG